MNKRTLTSVLITSSITTFIYANSNLSYTIVDTGQDSFFDNKGYIFKPSQSSDFYGQDAHYEGNKAKYKDNENGTITDIQTGLIWQKTYTKKMDFKDAVKYANSSKLGGFSDWRIPNIKELYSLINFNGKTGTARHQSSFVPHDAKPYINTDFFDFEYPNERRYIDAQYWTSTDYTSTTMNGNETFFGVNFADGRIKGYPKSRYSKNGGKYYLRLVRGNKLYGINDFEDNKDGTITDFATNLVWTKDDKPSLNWKEALMYCENLTLAGKDSWRLPNAKELQSIVDYKRSPDATNSASINPIFNTSKIKNEAGKIDYASYWTSTTHLDGKDIGSQAVYISFGRALGYIKNRGFNSAQLQDVHGSGAQRSDPKSGDLFRYKQGRGPQGDVVRIKNHVRCVLDNTSKTNTKRKVVEEIVKKEQKFEINKSKVINPAIKRFDKNSDKKISFDEAPPKMKENFKKHDLNDDGFIDIYEAKTLPKRRQ